MKRTLALVLLLAATTGLVAPALTAAPATTAPGYNFKIDVTIARGGKVVLSSSLAKRGWLVHFVIHNKDRKAHVFDVGGLKTKKPVPPGGIGRIGAYVDTRGQYPYKLDGRLRGYFVVN